MFSLVAEMFTKPAGIPKQPGCYMFRNGLGTVIYVGKAKSLANRLGSYFQNQSNLDAKTQNLMLEATNVEWIVVPTEIDALILENELIKANQPRFNIRLKDDKSFPYVAIDKREAFPMPLITRSRHIRGVKYFGPFVDVRALRTCIDELLQAFPVRSCTRHKYQYQQRIGRPCLLFDIGKCPGPCVDLVSETDYRKNIESWERFLDGDVDELRNLLGRQMREASSRRHYEAAARLRDSLDALERAASSQTIVLDDHSEADVIAVEADGSRAAAVRFKIRHGRIVGRSVHHIDHVASEGPGAILEAVLAETYPEGASVPPTVSLSRGTKDDSLIRDFLSRRRGAKTTVLVAQRGKWRRVTELAQSDARAVLERDSLRRQSDHNVRSRALREIADALHLEEPPYRIECFDMSHLQGTNYVGSMVVFEDGQPEKSQYRHFNVRESLGNDDVAAMREVLRRRLSRWNDVDGATSFRRPDLIVIDGGLPQLHAAEAAAKEVGVSDVRLVALAKREELIFVPGSSVPISLDRGSEGLYLLQRLRDEAHRFAITFHRSKRGKAMVASSLEGVSGLGASRRERLMAHFGSLEELRRASLSDLESLSWLPTAVAERLYHHLRGPLMPLPAKESNRDD